jgi:hypothetical protein
VVDNLLSLEALERLTNFCIASTIWTDFNYQTYVGTSLRQGLGCGIVVQIARELRSALGPLLAGRPLREAWVYKYDSGNGNANAVSPHGDAAAINVNIWLTDWQPIAQPSGQSAGKEKEGGGGLKLWLQEAPAHWDFESYNRRPTKLLAWLADLEAREGDEAVKTVRVNHQRNRAVIFNSNLIHQSDTSSAEGSLSATTSAFENRRMNLTMLFGDREASHKQ